MMTKAVESGVALGCRSGDMEVIAAKFFSGERAGYKTLHSIFFVG